MNNNDLNKALDDIFGNDFLEIDVNKNDDAKTNLKEDVAIEEKTNEEIKDDKKKNINYKIVIGTLAIFIILIFIIALNIKKEMVCVSNAIDTGYSFTDTYKITYKGNKIIYIEGEYKYTALNDEYKKNIEVVKDEKKHVILNSNGMPGFTYIYEQGDDYYKLSEYLDFKEMNFKKIDKIKQDQMPIAYFEINSKLTKKTLKNTLEKQGYTCSIK